ncbi:MAG: type I methionyl aminopeptidase [Candidatus Cloacimonetes bacterium]|nr:type I methionyl aminopeptidase [Candidatus Cloacimonadota bacterium]
MAQYRSDKDIQGITECCKIVAEVLNELYSYIKPGITTIEIERKADRIIKNNGAFPAFKGYTIPGLPPYPAAICASINSCIVHGIPREDVILKEGDIIGIDVGVGKNGYFGDAAKTYAVGLISNDARILMEVTEISLSNGIEQAVEGASVGDISYAIGSYVTSKGFYVADRLTGHGVGKNLHEEPMIPNHGVKGNGRRLIKGMTLAIEPMVNYGTNQVNEIGWEFFVADNSLSAHYEHTILITDHEPLILTQ